MQWKKELAPVAGQRLSGAVEIDNQLEQLNTEFNRVLAEASESGDQAAYSDRFEKSCRSKRLLKAERGQIQRMLAEQQSHADSYESNAGKPAKQHHM